MNDPLVQIENQIFLDAVAAVIVILAAEIDGPTRMGNFGDEFGRADHVVVFRFRLAARFRQNAQEEIGLNFTVLLESDAGAVAPLSSRRHASISHYEGAEVAVVHRVFEPEW